MLVTFKVYADGRTLRARTGEAKHDAAAAFKQHAQALVRTH